MLTVPHRGAAVGLLSGFIKHKRSPQEADANAVTVLLMEAVKPDGELLTHVGEQCRSSHIAVELLWPWRLKEKYDHAA